MRYDEVVRRYLAVRQASSREWSVSPGVILCVEFDMSADSYVTMTVAFSSSQRRRGPQFLRITVFREYKGTIDEPATFHGIDISQVGRPDLMFTADELAHIGQMRSLIDRWVKGDLAELPPSTSNTITQRLQGKSP